MSLNENSNAIKVTTFKSFKDLIENKESVEIVKNLVASKEDVLFFSDKKNEIYVDIIDFNISGIDASALTFPTTQEIKDRVIDKRNEENKENDLKNNNKFGF